MSYKILLIRPYQESLETAEILRSHQYEPIISPLLKITPLANLSLKAAKNYIITSQNAARLLPFANPCTIYSVGGKTTLVLQKRGFKNIYTASGNAQSLLELILQKASSNQTFLHFSGETLALDLAYELRIRGYEAIQQTAYQTSYNHYLTPEALQALNQREIFAVLFYSSKSCESFAKIIHLQKLHTILSSVYALSLSSSIEKTFKDLSWKGSYLSKEKSSASLIELLDQLRMKCHNSLITTARK